MAMKGAMEARRAGVNLVSVASIKTMFPHRNISARGEIAAQFDPKRELVHNQR
jgi:hypothetical protein